MPIEINLLKAPTPGRRRAEIVLDLDPDAFSRRHLREARAALAAFLDLPREEIKLVSVARWKPILEIDLPQESAEAVAEAFMNSDERLVEALGILRFVSVELTELPLEPVLSEPESESEPEPEPTALEAPPEPAVPPRSVTESEPAAKPEPAPIPPRESFNPYRLVQPILGLLVIAALLFMMLHPHQTLRWLGVAIGLILPLGTLAILAAAARSAMPESDV